MPATLQIKALMNEIAAGKSLDEDGIITALELLSGDEATPEARSAFLMGLRVRGETVLELTGAARHMRAKMLTVDAPDNAIDIVGTGGDGHGTYNVSTCAAIVAAGAGLKVAKHGNRSVSSKSGASDVLSALGVKLDADFTVVSQAIDQAGVGFLWAPMHHPIMKTWAPIRAELGIRSLFNLMGPLCNPAGVKRQVIGVFSEAWVEPVADVLVNLGAEHAWVVHGADGMDELTTTGATTVAEVKDGEVALFTVTPDAAGLPTARLDDLRGGDGQENAAALMKVLDGQPSAYRDIVVLNTAAALVVSERASNLADGAQQAAKAIDDGRAKAALERLVAISNGAAN
ncbi:MAG: anthranilate phosphoribosyltransferase [Pseudomonadota bacterium]